MTVEKLLRDNEELIFKSVQTINFTRLKSFYSPPDEYRACCLDKSKEDSFYVQKFDTYLLKWIDRLTFIDKNPLTQILSNKDILNVFYFKVWGDVIEHKDPSGRNLGYPVDKYKTLLMPIKIPKVSKDVFDTFYGKKSVDIIEGKFMHWDVCNVPHYWKYDISKGKEMFELLHIDFIE